MKALKDYFLIELDLMQRVKLKLSSADTAKAIQVLQDAGYLHDSEEYMTAGEATALKRTGKVFTSTNKGMLLWVTKEQHKILHDKSVCACEMMKEGAPAYKQVRFPTFTKYSAAMQELKKAGFTHGNEEEPDKALQKAGKVFLTVSASSTQTTLALTDEQHELLKAKGLV